MQIIELKQDALKIDFCYLGDCRDSMRKILAMGGAGKVQTIVTSPPYWGLRDYGMDGQIGLEPTIQEYVANMVEVFSLCRELLADDGTLWLNIGDSYASYRDGKATPDTARGESVGTLVDKGRASNRMASTFKGTSVKHKDLCGIPWRLAFALQDEGWHLRQDIIWHKPNPMPESVTDRCTKAHEYLFLLSKNERYYFDSDTIKERSANGIETRNRRSVWTISTESFSGAHFAVFPPALIEPCILAGSRAGNIVFDPFLGSGTTAQVAQSLGRKWIGCELNNEYIELQDNRTRQSGIIFSK